MSKEWKILGMTVKEFEEYLKMMNHRVINFKEYGGSVVEQNWTGGTTKKRQLYGNGNFLRTVRVKDKCLEYIEVSMDNTKDAVHFEAVKTSMSQSKAGTILRLAIHPNEVPANLHTDWVGSRYMVAMVKLNEQDGSEISS